MCPVGSGLNLTMKPKENKVFDRQVKDAEKSDNYLKVKSGDSFVVCCRGQDLTYDFLWDDTKKRSVWVDQGTPHARFGFRINVVLRDSFQVKILDKGISVYKRLQAIQKAGHPMDRTWLMLSREGSGKNDTEYTVEVLGPNNQMTEEEFAKLEGLKLFDLTPEQPESDVPVWKD